MLNVALRYIQSENETQNYTLPLNKQKKKINMKSIMCVRDGILPSICSHILALILPNFRKQLNFDETRQYENVSQNI